MRYSDIDDYERRPNGGNRRPANRQSASRQQMRTNYPPQRNPRRKKKKKHSGILERVLPVLIAVILIAVIIVVGIKTGLFDSFSYSSKKADLYNFFGSTSDDYAVVVDHGTITENKIRVINGYCYVDLPTVRETITERFYFDRNDNTLLYTNAEEVISSEIGSSSYTKGGTANSTPYQITVMEGDVLYIALDYISLFDSFAYNLQGGDGEPYRVEIRKESGKITQARFDKDQAIRVEADRESDILKEMSEHDIVTVLDKGDEWDLVQTDDLVFGYIEDKFLTGFNEIDEAPITTVTQPEFTYFDGDSPVNLVWDMVSNTSANDYLSDRLGSNAHGITVVSPTWFALSDNEGTITSIASHDYVDKCHSLGYKVWGLVDNVSYPDISMVEIFSYSSKRAHVIDQIISYAKEFNLDGINIDFESLSSEAGEPFIQFIRELYLRTRSEGLVLSSDNYVPKANTGVYNRDEQGTFLDYLIIMGYDEHYVGSAESGSVASIGFVTEGIEKTIEEVPAERVINAVPLYTRIWIEKPKTEAEIQAEDATKEYVPYKLEVQTVSMSDALSAVKNAGAEIRWDEETAQNYAEWQKEGATYKVWLEDTQSLKAKLDVMKAHDVAGVAAWQLGYASSDVWDLLDEYY